MFGKHLFKLIALTILLTQLTAYSEPFASGNITPAADDTGAAVSRGYIIPSAEVAPEGAKITVDIFHAVKNTPITLNLQAVVNDGAGKLSVITIATLHDQVIDNPDSYRSKRTFILDYAKINQALRQQAPNAPAIVIGPGTPLFVDAYFYNGHSTHNWGGVSRGGLFYLPSTGSELVSTTHSTAAIQSRPDVLDIAVPISQTLANLFNSGNKRSVGIKVGGQIRSRVEAEGKYQISPEEYPAIRDSLLKIANDPVLARQVMGADWTISLETRYLKKDSTGKIMVDAKGVPSPDPMVDTYYDNLNYDGAKNDMAFRYRWTEGNQTGAWNFKPGMGNTSPEGVVYRVEYGIDTTDDKPETIRKFADSTHPLNPFRIIPTVIPGAKASDFLVPSVKVTDYRLKFKLKHKDGLLIEMSLDDVNVAPLRTDAALKPAQYYQLEMDIDHLGVQSNRTSAAASGSVQGMYDVARTPAFLGTLTNSAFFDGRPVLHSLEDLQVDSPVRTLRIRDFQLSTDVIKNLTGHLMGANWKSGAQKYAFAALAVGAVKPDEASKSVKATLESVNKGASLVKTKSDCLSALTKMAGN